MQASSDREHDPSVIEGAQSPRRPLEGAAAAPVAGTAAPAPAPRPADPGVIVRRALAHWRLVLLALFLGALVAAPIVRARKPLFKSETVIFHSEGISRSISGPVESADSLRTLGAKLKEVLLAAQILRSIIDEQGLYRDLLQSGGYADAVDQMRKRIEFKARSQDTFAISFEGTTREESQLVCARLAETLVSTTAQRQAEEMAAASAFLEVEKTQADEDLAAREREVSEFLTAHPELAGVHDALGAETLAEQKKGERVAEDARRGKRLWGSLPRRADGTVGGSQAAPPVDPVLVATRAQAMTEVFAAKKDLDGKLLRYTDQHPDVRAAAARVQAAETALQRADEAVAAALPPPPPPSFEGAREPDAGARANAPAGVAAPGDEARPHDTALDGKTVALETDWSRLSRLVTLARTRQSDLEQKLYRARLLASTTRSGHGSKIVILDPAYLPSAPSNVPNRTIVLITFVISLVMGLALSVGRGLFLDDRLFSSSEVEPVVGLPLFGVVPPTERRLAAKGGERGR